MSDYLVHYGRKGMKWGKHIFGEDELKEYESDLEQGIIDVAGEGAYEHVKKFLKDKNELRRALAGDKKAIESVKAKMAESEIRANKTKLHNNLARIEAKRKRMSQAPRSNEINEGKLEREHAIKYDMYRKRDKSSSDPVALDVAGYWEKSDNAAREGDIVKSGQYGRMALAAYRINSKETNVLRRWGKEMLYKAGILSL